MQVSPRWADRARSIQPARVPVDPGVEWHGVSRLGVTQLSAPKFSIWLQVRGSTTVNSREGSFRLVAGDWIAFERGSAPELRAGRNGMTLGLAVSDEAMQVHADASGHGLLTGSGRAPAYELAITLRLWRQAMNAEPGEIQSRPMQQLLQQLARLQHELRTRIGLCPGRTHHRKRQVFGRMQSARLCLQGQSDGELRIADLAKRINFSPWYFSKVFHAVYGIGPQQFSAQMRLERASRLLATTSLPVTEVSAACGFENPCSFARAFRARYGTTASQHRLGGHR